MFQTQGKLYDAGAAFLFVLMVVGIFFLMQEEKVPQRRERHRVRAALGTLDNLSTGIAKLTKSDFKNKNAWSGQRAALLSKIEAVYTQIQAGAYQGAVEKLQNDVEDKIRKWVVQRRQSELLDKAEAVVVLF